MTRHAPVNILLLCVLFALGCSTKTATPFDLTHATELVASAGTEREVRLQRPHTSHNSGDGNAHHRRRKLSGQDQPREEHRPARHTCNRS
jgi:hypothetical protein